jgi:dTDP-4-dehydrorhamnose reductase
LRVLITGGSGNLGRELVKANPECLHPSHSELDISNEKAVREYARVNKPDELIHCAALIGIRQCDEDKNKAFSINVQGTRNLVRGVLEYSPECLFVYMSTASVFDGDVGDYTESDVPNPRNFYSLTKLLGEFVVSESALANSLILRANLVPRKKWAYPKAFSDRFGTYLFADDLAKAISHVIDEGLRGIVHVCGEEKLSMFELAKLTTPEVLPMTLKEYTGPSLPVDMSLRSVRVRSFPLTRNAP